MSSGRPQHAPGSAGTSMLRAALIKRAALRSCSESCALACSSARAVGLSPKPRLRKRRKARSCSSTARGDRCRPYAEPSAWRNARPVETLPHMVNRPRCSETSGHALQGNVTNNERVSFVAAMLLPVTRRRSAQAVLDVVVACRRARRCGARRAHHETSPSKRLF